MSLVVVLLDNSATEMQREEFAELFVNAVQFVLMSPRPAQASLAGDVQHSEGPHGWVLCSSCQAFAVYACGFPSPSIKPRGTSS